jgi:hypothetical protein
MHYTLVVILFCILELKKKCLKYCPWRALTYFGVRSNKLRATKLLFQFTCLEEVSDYEGRAQNNTTQKKGKFILSELDVVSAGEEVLHTRGNFHPVHTQRETGRMGSAQGRVGRVAIKKTAASIRTIVARCSAKLVIRYLFEACKLE